MGSGSPRPLILASRSPQRRAILEQLGLQFSVHVPGVEEVAEGTPEEVVAENARRKAMAVAGRFGDALVLGADTVVFVEGRIFGKAAGPEQARHMLEALDGRTHTVVGGICLAQDGRLRTGVAHTEVLFRRLSEPLISWYLASEEWRERAGSYAIQGRGAALVAEIRGDYLNVVGLPVATLLELEPGLLS